MRAARQRRNDSEVPLQSRSLVPVVATVTVIIGVLVAIRTLEPPTVTVQSGVLLDQPRAIAEFSLLDQNGQRFDRSRLQGRWSVVFAGFTHCPDACPNTLGLLKAVDTRLRQDGADVQTVFLSVDPERDRPEQLQQYVSFFSPDFVGVTGDVAQIDALCRNLGVAYIKVPGTTDDDYTIDHTTALVLINPNGDVAGYLQPPFDVDALHRDLLRLSRVRS
jgi:protein SCO1